jgi:hypothetical protein
MDEMIKVLKERTETLRKGIARAEKDVGTFPDGWLRINPSANRLRYYHLTDTGDSEGEYIKKEKRRLAYQLAQKDYNNKFLKEAKRELSRLELTIEQLSKENANLVFQRLSANRQNLVTPYITTDSLFAREWQSRCFQSNPYRTENKIYDTRRGDKVRSKSEAILADIFYELKIPYHYEKPIKLRNGNTRYPDFTLLNVKTREEFYFEHFGLLDDEEYRRDCFNKLDEYRNSGIYIGKNLIFTYETTTNPLDIKGIRRMVAELFC